MLPQIETARLTLRLARPGMEAAMAKFLADNYPGHLDRWSPPHAEGFFSADFWRERLEAAVEEYRAGRSARFVLQLRAGAQTPIEAPVIGTCNYTNIVRGAFHACHLGYQIAREQEGRGLMAEALRATNAFVFETLRLHRVMANFRPGNDRSRRLLARLGFVEEGLAKDYLFIDGAWRDHVLTSLVNPSYEDDWIFGA